MTLPPFYPILDTAALHRCGLPATEAARALLDAGSRILQWRHKGPLTRAAFAAAETIACLCQEAGALFIVNDRADLSMLFGAGLHVGQDDLPLADARRLIGPTRCLGFSTHNAAQLQSAETLTADYLALGPIFGTQSKTNPDPDVGLAGLRHGRTLTTRPLVAIGGITRATALSVREAGADTIAVIGDLYTGLQTPADLRQRACDWITLLGA